MTSTDKAKAWSDVFWRHVRQGCDRSDAAFRADHAELVDGPNGINSMATTIRRIWAALEKHNTGKVEISEIVTELVRERDEAKADRDAFADMMKAYMKDWEATNSALNATRKLLAEAGEVIEQVLSGYLNDSPARSILTRIKEATNNDR